MIEALTESRNRYVETPQGSYDAPGSLFGLDETNYKSFQIVAVTALADLSAPKEREIKVYKGLTAQQVTLPPHADEDVAAKIRVAALLSISEIVAPVNGTLAIGFNQEARDRLIYVATRGMHDLPKAGLASMLSSLAMLRSVSCNFASDKGELEFAGVERTVLRQSLVNYLAQESVKRLNYEQQASGGSQTSGSDAIGVTRTIPHARRLAQDVTRPGPQPPLFIERPVMVEYARITEKMLRGASTDTGRQIATDIGDALRTEISASALLPDRKALVEPGLDTLFFYRLIGEEAS